jgi:hypothetical protein
MRWNLQLKTSKMSNYLAIATVTATLQRTLQQAIQRDVDGARVTTARPDGSGSGTPETGINLYLYHLKRNPAWGNADMPSRQRKGEMVKRNQIALDLYYLLSVYGNEAELEPQRLLGSALRTMEDRAIVSPQMIRDTVSEPIFNFLSNSDLAEQLDMVRAELLPVSTDDLSKVWSVFLQTPYSLSVVYKVSVVLLEGEDPSRPPLPVRERFIGGSAFSKQPTIDSVIPAVGKYQPILANSTLLIRGKMLAGATTLVRLCGVEVTPQTASDTEISLPLASVPTEALRAGVQGLQVIHQQIPSTSPPNGRTEDRQIRSAVHRQQLAAHHQRVESNVAPIIIRPSLKEVRLSNVETRDDDSRSADITVVTDLTIALSQQPVIKLNERTVNEPAIYTFSARRLNEDTTEPSFPIQGVKPGEYLVRVQVDGAESMLQVDKNPNSPTFEQYIGPTIAIP